MNVRLKHNLKNVQTSWMHSKDGPKYSECGQMQFVEEVDDIQKDDLLSIEILVGCTGYHP